MSDQQQEVRWECRKDFHTEVDNARVFTKGAVYLEVYTECRYTWSAICFTDDEGDLHWVSDECLLSHFGEVVLVSGNCVVNSKVCVP